MMLVGYNDVVESKVMAIKWIVTESSIGQTADAGPEPGFCSNNVFFSVIDDVLQKCRQI